MWRLRLHRSMHSRRLAHRRRGRQMKILAIICAFQEADIIGWTVRHLKRQGCDVVVIDCESTDGTDEVVADAGAVVMPYHAPPVSWHALLGVVEKAAAAIGKY